LPFGYNKQILRINLSRNTVRIERPSKFFYRRYFGGRGIIAYYLLKELRPGIAPLGPRNILIFASGVVTGAPIPGSGRHGVGAKSPLTGAYGEAEAGGFWGAELKHAGFDAIVVKGRAKSPVYLWVNDGEVEIRDAQHLWGLDIGDSQEIIRKEVGERLARTAQIGKAGERTVRFACIINDLKHAAGRVGMGGVMGSKKLKAIAIRGHDGPEMAHPEKLKELTRWLRDNLEQKAGRMHKYGTGAMMTEGALSGNLPVHNFRDGEFSNPEAISAQTIKEKVRIRMESCYFCPIRCKKVVQVKKPYAVNPLYGGPEYETLATFGSNCGINDLKAICKAHELCQRYTLDTISTGCTIAFAMECFENKLLTKKDTDGIDLTFGNPEAMLQMVEMIAKREGIGDLLAEGTMRAAKKIGREAEKFAIHVKGEEVPMHDPRLKRGLGLGYAVKPTGAEHMNNLHDTWTRDMPSFGIIRRVPLEDLSWKKVRLYIYKVIYEIIKNCLLLCDFVPWNENHIIEIIRAVTGWNSNLWEIMKVSERSINMARAFNVREGFTRKDDWLPDRFFHPQTSGPLSETAVDPKQLENAKTTYYGMMGWNQKGVPTRAKLEELDIPWVADKINL